VRKYSDRRGKNADDNDDDDTESVRKKYCSTAAGRFSTRLGFGNPKEIKVPCWHQQSPECHHHDQPEGYA
jgi:hypothetical protein